MREGNFCAVRLDAAFMSLPVRLKCTLCIGPWDCWRNGISWCKARYSRCVNDDAFAYMHGPCTYVDKLYNRLTHPKLHAGVPCSLKNFT